MNDSKITPGYTVPLSQALGPFHDTIIVPYVLSNPEKTYIAPAYPTLEGNAIADTQICVSGKVEKLEKPIDAAKREIREELGMNSIKMTEIQSLSFTKRLGAFSTATLISRILGYVRDALVASHFGGGVVTDAFYAAFKVPNLLRRFLGEGSLTAAFVPVFTDIQNKEGKKEANLFLNSLMSGLIIILLIVVILGMIGAPWVAKLVAWGFSDDPEKMQLTSLSKDWG